jgi:hypothetical protein
MRSATFLLVLLGLAACGSETRVNRERPPAPINVTAAIHPSRVQVSPATFGAGPIVLIVSNQSSRAQAVTFETAGRAAGITSSTGSISPRGTARLQVVVPRGTYSVRVGDRTIRPARVVVGAKRPSAQDDLLQP